MSDEVVQRVALALLDALETQPDPDERGRTMGSYVRVHAGLDDEGEPFEDGPDRVLIDGFYDLTRLARAAIAALAAPPPEDVKC
jgi:hypothetical protein